MKKNYLLLAIFLVLGAGTAWYLIGSSKDEKTTLGWDRKFKVENQEEIQKIFIAKRNGVTTTLEREGDRWRVNKDNYANPYVMESLLEAICHVELKFVPPKNSLPKIVGDLASTGIKVEIFNKKGDKIKAYYVGGVTSDTRGTYFILENAEQPMAVEIPMMEGQIRTRYELEGDEWRDKTVFSYKPEEIAAVSIEYPKQRSKSFKLKKDGSDYTVVPFYDNVPPVKEPASKDRAAYFLEGFDRLIAENYINHYSKQDSIRSLVPFAVVTVETTAGQEKKATFYESYKINSTTGTRSSDFIERYYTDVSTGDFMLTQHHVFSKIFWPYEGFFEAKGVKVKD
ncbi:MAG: DUF4340 domain-containing protein [Lewinellaceae bacterium]|nr:DUF4340 domain-containing protein [Lewinellaceae bacterium]